MAVRHSYELVQELANDLLGRMFQWALDVASTVGLVVHSDRVRLGPRALALFERMDPYLVSKTAVTEWPGTRLIGERKAILRTYRFTNAAADSLVAAAERLYAWVNPDLPEDLHLLRRDGSLVLGSITQEHEAWMDLTDEEYASLVSQAPEMAGLLRQTK